MRQKISSYRPPPRRFASTLPTRGRVSDMIGDDHSGERPLMPFCTAGPFHGLTTITHHCSILITDKAPRNSEPGPEPSTPEAISEVENQEKRPIRMGGTCGCLAEAPVHLERF